MQHAMSIVRSCWLQLHMSRLTEIDRKAQAKVLRRPDGMRTMQQAEADMPLLDSEADGQTKEETEDQ